MTAPTPARPAGVRRRSRAALLLAVAVTTSLVSQGMSMAAPGDAPATAASAVATSGALVDSDGDALPDDWEINGYDADGDGDVDVDLPAMGADPQRKDIFVEMDYMGAQTSCPCYLPKNKDLKRIVKAYKRSPYADNPDGSKGIKIHLDAGDARAPRYDLGGGNLVPLDLDLNPYTTETNAIKATNFDPVRAKVFHYMLWAHGYGGGSSSGVSFGIPADTFLVTLGLWPEGGSSDAKVGTFIHEIGHNLGIRHGGTDNTNYKPNYLSVMSYAFQIDGVDRVGKGGYYGYAKETMPLLVEPLLDENVGIDSPDAAGYRTSWWCNGVLETTDGSAFGPIDWNCNGDIQGAVSHDVNQDGFLTTLTGPQDWGHLVFDGGAVGEGASTPGAPLTEPELSYEQYVADGHDH